jgi:AcrR family transcriptional regulator
MPAESEKQQARREISAAAPAPRARRLDPDARREQLFAAPVAAAASAGYSGLTLDEVAERSGVTRSLIYHYFPRGRQDLFIAAVDRAGHELTENWVVDSDTPIEERLAANFARFFAHALEPSAIWLVHRQASVAGDPEVDEVFEHYRAIVVSAVALNHFGTEDPPPAVCAGLRAYLAFAESALDEWREQDLDPEDLYPMLAGSLLAVVDSLWSLSDG